MQNINTTQSNQNMTAASSMTDRDWATDVLLLLKHMNVSYSTALNEASTEPLSNQIMTFFNDTQKAQHTLFQIMQQQGWYQVKPETPAALQQTAQKAQQDQQQLPAH
ncbi:spore coat protein [Jeotgalibacillus soli]|uniref:Spore coat protein n=1 Tax=Jeotgalibacillus soli TaxID=889306 RepID=A0A0C2RLP2_9BACL|nr:spore coat protein [Jeotgalibacillus soli]KIL42669.1 hypothetical protein KP78_38920 [Jeotgalibacillus soli]